MKKRIISIALVVVMIVAMIPAMLVTTSAMQYYDGFDSPIVSEGAITVDANATPDSVYLAGEQIVPVSFKNGNTSYFRGYTAADQNGFYIWFNVTDPTTDKAEGWPKEVTITDEDGDYTEIQQVVKGVNSGDYFQLYFRATTLTAKQVGALTFDYVDGGRVIADGGIKGGAKADMVDCATTLVEGGYILEAYIPFACLASNGTEIFDGATVEDINVAIGVQVTDYVNTTEADTQTDYCYSHAKGGSFYRGVYANHTSSTENPDDRNGGFAGTRFTPLNFSGFHTNVTADTINVDGKMDAAYAKSDLIKSSTAWGETGSFNAYTAATLDGLYIWAEILDTTLTKKEFERIDLGDKFQVYFQMGTKTSARDWGYIEIDYRDYMYTAASDYENDVLKVDAVSKPAFNVTNKTGATFSDGKGINNASCEYATTKMYNADGSDKGWTAEIFVPWTGEAAINNISSLDDIFCSVGFQVNDYTINDAASTPSTYKESYTRQGLSYSDRDGSRYYFAWNSKDGSGHYYFTNLIFKFDEDTPDLLNKKWAAYTDSITFDGVKDAAYSEYTRQPVDWVYSQTDGKGWVTDGSINLADTYYAFTDDAVYVFVDVYDTTGYTSHANEYVSIYWSVSDYMGKFNLRSDKAQGSKGTYEGVVRNYTLLADDKSNIDVANLALTYKGTPGEEGYTGYCVEFKIDLPEPEKLALQQGKSIAVNVGVEINDAGVQQSSGNTGRTYYGFSAPCGGGWWIGMNYAWTYTSGGWGGPILPRVILDKDLSLDLFDVENPFKINSANVALGESISVNYYVNLPANATNAKMRFTMNDKVTIANARKTNTVGEYKFVFDGVAPQCMGDNIVAELIVDGEVVDTLADYSVYQNCMNIVLKDLENAALVALIGDLGAYGAAAQKYANYKTDDLVNEGYEHFATTIGAIENADRVIGAANVDGAKFTALGVYFDNTNKIYAKIEVADYIDVDDLTVTIDGEAATIEKYGDAYIVYTDDILVTEFDNVYTIELSDGTNSQTVTYSVNAYCAAKQNAEKTATAELAKALYAYGKSAEAYIA